MQDIITRKEAISQQLARYFTGNPCKNGHVAERRTKDSRCMECERVYGKSFRENNPDVMKVWRDNNPEYAKEKYYENKEDRLIQNKKWYEENKERVSVQRKEWYYSDETQSKLKQWRRQWYADNPSYDKQYYENNRERFLTVLQPAQRQRYRQRQKHKNHQIFAQLAAKYVLPENPTEHDFKYWIAGEITRRTGWTVYKEVWLDDARTSRIDLMIPEAHVGIELKLSTINHPPSYIKEQHERYQQLAPDGYAVLVVTLDGSVGIDASTFLEHLPAIATSI